MAYYHTENADSLRNIDPLVIRHLVISCVHIPIYRLHCHQHCQGISKFSSSIVAYHCQQCDSDLIVISCRYPFISLILDIDSISYKRYCAWLLRCPDDDPWHLNPSVSSNLDGEMNLIFFSVEIKPPGGIAIGRSGPLFLCMMCRHTFFPKCSISILVYTLSTMKTSRHHRKDQERAAR